MEAKEPQKKDDFESVVLEHIRLNGTYWGLTTLDVLGKLDVVDQDEVVSWIMQCQHESGGFGGNIGHDPHVLFTLSAIQVLALFDKIDVLDFEKDMTPYIASLQNEDGSFAGDMWGEVDTRFSYIALCSLEILHHLDKVNVERALNYIVSCKNLDGGFGCTPRAESHAGQKKAEKKIELEKLAPIDDIYVKTRKRKPGRQYKLQMLKMAVVSKLKNQAMVPTGFWVDQANIEKQSKISKQKLLSSSTPTDMNDLKKTIREEIMAEMQEMVDRKVSEKMTKVILKLGEINPDFKHLHLEELCASSGDESEDNNDQEDDVHEDENHENDLNEIHDD
ncbi:hypothetical protein OROMI_023890 [Orobanche minor]